MTSDELHSHQVQCPYCWESFELVVDGSVPQQEYIEDCEVCCRPIVLLVTVAGPAGDINVVANREDD